MVLYVVVCTKQQDLPVVATAVTTAVAKVLVRKPQEDLLAWNSIMLLRSGHGRNNHIDGQKRNIAAEDCITYT